MAAATQGVHLRNPRARIARLRDLRLLLETRTIQKLGRRKHWCVVPKPTQIALIAQISQSDSVRMEDWELDVAT